MLGSAVALTSSIPSAFSALGVGAVGFVSAAILVSTWPPERLGIEKVDLPSKMATSETLSSLFPIALAFAGLAFAYALGLAMISLGGRLRVSFWGGFDPQRAAFVAQSRNEFLQKSYLELKAANSILDGLGISSFFFFASSAAAMSQVNGWAFALIGLAVACSSCWTFWREVDQRNREFDEVVLAFQQYSTRDESRVTLNTPTDPNHTATTNTVVEVATTPEGN
ncbi:hypothetical protein R3X27_05025 [Tropicimonas sp. TH_r6]|uniref:hypothetical protein n=1 Tax=Tropicimonas sp. TH_r6 TaxID=3082085 RepID=UPI0029540C3C|nr:hypothetical protein [Tropicimonas sp. TH_r6]MDV7142040.1 hypothetical protein [Tropicimonas sp. TH_r6]